MAAGRGLFAKPVGDDEVVLACSAIATGACSDRQWTIASSGRTLYTCPMMTMSSSSEMAVDDGDCSNRRGASLAAPPAEGWIPCAGRRPAPTCEMVRPRQ